DADHGDVFALRSKRRIAHHVVPPGLLDVPLQLDAERSVIPETVDAAVDFTRLEDEATPPTQRHQLFHIHHKPLTDYLCQCCLTIPTAPTSTRNGSLRSSGTKWKRSTWAAVWMSS